MSKLVSVVVVSHHRDQSLFRTILGLSQVQYPTFEIVVVADASGLAALKPFDGKIKTICFEEANISKARNLGVSYAAGEIIAFLDDDAVPEPTWLTFLMAPFEDPNVGLVGGFVLGRNGISYQWKARQLDSFGFAQKIDVEETFPTIFSPEKDLVLKTEGTNMAVRRDALVILSGFDPAYHFYLDETDMNMRFGEIGMCSAIAPQALVHHGFASSKRRREDRVPRDLFDIGASWAVFQRKFINSDLWAEHWNKVIAAQNKRAISHMISGGLEPSGVRRLMRRLREGYHAGKTRAVGTGDVSNSPLCSFQPFPFANKEYHFLEGRPNTAPEMRRQAKKAVQENVIATLFIFSLSSLYHKVSFTSDGYWQQTGGIWGKSKRSQPWFQAFTMKERMKTERKRIQEMRGERWLIKK